MYISQRQTFSYDGIDSDAMWKNEMWWDCKVEVLVSYRDM